MGGFIASVGGVVAPFAVAFLAEGIHILNKKIKERDRIVRHANNNISDFIGIPIKITNFCEITDIAYCLIMTERSFLNEI